MFKKLTYIVFAIVLFVLSTRGVYAQNTAGASAEIKTGENTFDYRVYSLEKYLKSHNSPLSEYADEFVAAADEYDMDYRMVPAIAGVESTFGKRIPKNSYNAYGWANGEYSFTSWEDSIDHVTMTLRKNYMNKGATSVNRIARIYAPPSTTWGSKVKFFMKKIDPIPVGFSLEG